jgi:tetratricopeptide (TPR) repeat protein
MIISAALCQQTISLIHDIAQLRSIFIFCASKTRHEQWIKTWSKIKGVFTEITPICDALKYTARQWEQNAISISFMSTSNNVSKKNLDQLDCSFMYTRILMDTLLTIEFEQKHIKEFTDYCQEQFADNNLKLDTIIKFERKYHDQTPIWWYSSDCFLYPMLNQALRLMDIHIILKMSFFIRDLIHHIVQLYLQQFVGYHSGNIFTLYRGQGLSTTDFNQMTNTKGGLIAFNSFLSTSKNRDVSLMFAESNSNNPDMVGILFVMSIDPTQATTCFASITEVGYYGDEEDEVLFSMQSVFRIQNITSMGDNNRLYEVKLTLTSDNDEDLLVLTERIRQEIPGSGWYSLGEILRKMGHFDKAEKVYQILLDQTKNESAKADIYHPLALAKDEQGKYQEAIELFEKALEIYQKILPPNHPSLGASYDNIGAVYGKMGDYKKALSYYEKALKIQQESLPPNHPDLGASYNNIGTVSDDMGDYSKALTNYEKALEIQQQSLPPNHPSLGVSYNNIGTLYVAKDEYRKALSYFEKALAIRQQSLPPNHPSLGASYNNIGVVYKNMGDYPKALSNYEKALQIREQSLPPNHPDLGASYNNIGMLYSTMGDYPKALSNYEKALEIQQQSLPSNHPHLGKYYDNIGAVYHNMGDYSKAHSFYERAVENGQRSLPANHSTLQNRKNKLEDVKRKM